MSVFAQLPSSFLLPLGPRQWDGAAPFRVGPLSSVKPSWKLLHRPTRGVFPWLLSMQLRLVISDITICITVLTNEKGQT